jgi:hypothetical protein
MERERYGPLFWTALKSHVIGLLIRQNLGGRASVPGKELYFGLTGIVAFSGRGESCGKRSGAVGTRRSERLKI